MVKTSRVGCGQISTAQTNRGPGRVTHRDPMRPEATRPEATRPDPTREKPPDPRIALYFYARRVRFLCLAQTPAVVPFTRSMPVNKQ